MQIKKSGSHIFIHHFCFLQTLPLTFCLSLTPRRRRKKGVETRGINNFKTFPFVFSKKEKVEKVTGIPTCPFYFCFQNEFVGSLRGVPVFPWRSIHPNSKLCQVCQFILTFTSQFLFHHHHLTVVLSALCRLSPLNKETFFFLLSLSLLPNLEICRFSVAAKAISNLRARNGLAVKRWRRSTETSIHLLSNSQEMEGTCLHTVGESTVGGKFMKFWSRRDKLLGSVLFLSDYFELKFRSMSNACPCRILEKFPFVYLVMTIPLIDNPITVSHSSFSSFHFLSFTTRTDGRPEEYLRKYVTVKKGDQTNSPEKIDATAAIMKERMTPGPATVLATIPDTKYIPMWRGAESVSQSFLNGNMNFELLRNRKSTHLFQHNSPHPRKSSPT